MTPYILGIVNLTADSFSDGGLYLKPEDAIAHGQELMGTGADILDLGAASSHPDSEAVAPEEEIRRLEPVIVALKNQGAIISVDSYHTPTQRFALAAGAHYLNDIQGFADSNFYTELAEASCKLIVMHSIQTQGPAQRVLTERSTLWDRVIHFFDERLVELEAAGVSRDRFVIDPGMGFFLGDTPELSLEILSRLPELKARYDLPVLVSVSRKSFLRAVTDCSVEESGSATLAAELFAVLQGVAYIRTHEPRPLRDGIKIWRHISSEQIMRNMV